MKKTFFSILFFINFMLCAFAQEADSVVQVRNSPFINELVSKKEYIYPMLLGPSSFLPTKTPSFSERGRVLIKTPGNLYVQLMASGFLFKLNAISDSILTFKRIDKTDNINYNLGAYYFSKGEDLYNFGGYGFWKSNGLLRRYNFISNDWGTEPISEEIHPQYAPLNNAWYDNKTNRIYLPFERIVNGGLQQRAHIKGEINKRSAILDLKTGTWQNVGKATEKCLSLMGSGIFKINCARGLIVIADEEVYLFDFTKNEIFKLRDNIVAQTLLKIGTGGSHLFYHAGKKIHYHNIYNNISGSIEVNLDQFVSLDEKIYREDPINYILPLGALVMLAGIIYLMYRKRKKRQKDTGIAQTHEPAFQISFTDVEKNLLLMLMDKSKKKENAIIADINYVLGVKDKNTGLQKKVRSDTFNSINEKYRIITQKTDPLIQSIRSEVDKRYFEYFIHQHEAKELSKILNG